jgi:hypothetical protein
MSKMQVSFVNEVPVLLLITEYHGKAAGNWKM